MSSVFMIPLRILCEKTAGDFLRIVVTLGMTFLDLADNAPNPESFRASRQRAEMAYRTVSRFMLRVRIPPEQMCQLSQDLELLRSRLNAVADFYPRTPNTKHSVLGTPDL